MHPLIKDLLLDERLKEPIHLRLVTRDESPVSFYRSDIHEPASMSSLIASLRNIFDDESGRASNPSDGLQIPFKRVMDPETYLMRNYFRIFIVTLIRLQNGESEVRFSEKDIETIVTVVKRDRPGSHRYDDQMCLDLFMKEIFDLLQRKVQSIFWFNWLFKEYIYPYHRDILDRENQSGWPLLMAGPDSPTDPIDVNAIVVHIEETLAEIELSLSPK